MIYISIAIVLSVAIFGYIAVKFIELQYAKLESTKHINNESAMAELSAAMDERFKKFDSRLNDTWGTISSVKEEINAIRLQLALGKKHE